MAQKEEFVTCFVCESQVWEGIRFAGFCEFFSEVASSVAIEFWSRFVDAENLDLIIIYNIFRQWKCRFAHQIQDEEYVAN